MKNKRLRFDAPRTAPRSPAWRRLNLESCEARMLLATYGVDQHAVGAALASPATTSVAAEVGHYDPTAGSFDISNSTAFDTGSPHWQSAPRAVPPDPDFHSPANIESPDASKLSLESLIVTGSGDSAADWFAYEDYNSLGAYQSLGGSILFASEDMATDNVDFHVLPQSDDPSNINAASGHNDPLGNSLRIGDHVSNADAIRNHAFDRIAGAITAPLTSHDGLQIPAAHEGTVADDARTHPADSQNATRRPLSSDHLSDTSNGASIQGPRLLNPNSAPTDFDSPLFSLSQIPAQNNATPSTAESTSRSINFGASGVNASLEMTRSDNQESMGTGPALAQSSSGQSSSGMTSRGIKSARPLGGDVNSDNETNSDSGDSADTELVVATPELRVQPQGTKTENRQPSEIDIARVFYAYDAAGRPVSQKPAASVDNSEGQIALRDAEPRRGVARSMELSAAPDRALAGTSRSRSQPAAIDVSSNSRPSLRLRAQLDPLGKYRVSTTGHFPASVVEGTAADPLIGDPDSTAARQLAWWEEALGWTASQMGRLLASAGSWLPHTGAVMVLSVAALFFSPREERKDHGEMLSPFDPTRNRRRETPV